MIREVRGALDRVSACFLPDEVGLVAELLADGQVLETALVQEDGTFRIELGRKQEIKAKQFLLQIRPDVPERPEQALQIPLHPEQFKNGLIDLTKQPILIPRRLKRLWLPWLETCCVRGRVVGCKAKGENPMGEPEVTCCPVRGATVEAYVIEWSIAGPKRRVVATAVTDENGFFRVCTFRFKLPKVVLPNDLPFDWRDLLPWPPPFPVDVPPPIPQPEPGPGPMPAPPYEGILRAWERERRLTADAMPALPEAMPRLAGIEAARMIQQGEGLPAGGPLMHQTQTHLQEMAIQHRALAEVSFPSKIGPFVPPIIAPTCAAGWHYRVTQHINGVKKVVYDDGFFPLPHSTWPSGYITLYANSEAVCGVEGPPELPLGGKCFVFTGVGNIGRDLIDGWADTSPLWAPGSPGPGNVPYVRDAAFAGYLNVYGIFSAGWTHYKVEVTRRSGTLRTPGGPVGWTDYDEPFAYAAQYLNTDPSDPEFNHVRTITVVSTPVTVAGERLYPLPAQVVEAHRPGPAWTPLPTLQPVTLGFHANHLLPGGAGRFLFQVTPVRVQGGVIVESCQPAAKDAALDLVIDNTPLRVGVTSLTNQLGDSILNAPCPKAHLAANTDKLSASFQALDDFGHMAELRVFFTIGNAGQRTIIPVMHYTGGTGYVGTYGSIPAGPGAAATGPITVNASFPAPTLPSRYFAGGTGSLDAHRPFWIDVNASILTEEFCPFALTVQGRKRTTNGLGTPGTVSSTRLFVIKV